MYLYVLKKVGCIISVELWTTPAMNVLLLFFAVLLRVQMCSFFVVMGHEPHSHSASRVGYTRSKALQLLSLSGLFRSPPLGCSFGFRILQTKAHTNTITNI